MSTYNFNYTLKSGQEIIVEYEVVSWGSLGSYWEPPEGIEIELVKHYDAKTDEPVVLTDDEAEAIEVAIHENPPKDDDYDGYGE